MRRTLSRLAKIEQAAQSSSLGVCPHKWNVIHEDEAQPESPVICPICNLPRNEIVIVRFPRGLAAEKNALQLKWVSE